MRLVWLLLCLAMLGASTLILVVGLSTLTQATQGAGLIAAACFGGILARMLQAAGHQHQLMQRAEPRRSPSPTPAPSEAAIEAEVARLTAQRAAEYPIDRLAAHIERLAADITQRTGKGR